MFKPQLPKQQQHQHHRNAGAPPAYEEARASISSESQPLLNQAEEGRPVVNPKWFAPISAKKDHIFSVLFFIHLAITGAFSVFGIFSVYLGLALIRNGSPAPAPSPSPSPSPENGWVSSVIRSEVAITTVPSPMPNPNQPKWDWEPTTTQVIGLPMVIILSSIATTAAFYWLLIRFRSNVMKITSTILSIFMVIVFALFVVMQNWPGAIFYGIIALISCFVTYKWYRGTSVIKKLFDAVLDVVASSPGMATVGIVAAAVRLVFTVLWLFAFLAALLLFGVFRQKDAQKDVMWGPFIAVYFYLLFSMLWTSEVINNVVNVTLGGVFATYHLTGVPDEDGKITVAIRRPVTAAAKRALGPSFGSICFGSLVIALLSWLQAIIQKSEGDTVSGNNGLISLLFCCFKCLLSIFKDLLQFLNKYAFTYVAIYGEDYCTSAKATFSLFKERGLDVVVTDAGSKFAIFSCVFSVVLFHGIAVGIPSVFIFGVPLTSGLAPMFAITAVFTFVCGICMSMIASILEAGSAATFVCLAEDPVAMSYTRPELVESVSGLYPNSGFASTVVMV